MGATLGELLAAVLPPPGVADGEAVLLAGRTFTRELAGDIGVEPALVWDRLTVVPDNMLSLLDSPEGWTALGLYIAADLGVPAIHFKPTVH